MDKVLWAEMNSNVVVMTILKDQFQEGRLTSAY